MERNRYYSKSEEIANSATHGLGILMGIIGGTILLITALKSENPSWATGCTIVYIAGMLISYISSTCYHACSYNKLKTIFRKLDHAAIYTHIAGTYVPFTLLVLRNAGAWGWSLFTFIWAAAMAGIILSFMKLKKHSHFETTCYVIMGCSILIALKPLAGALNEIDKISALYWLIGGGISYIAGVIFYSLTKIKYMHTVFHLFVLAGSACHIIAIYLIL